MRLHGFQNGVAHRQCGCLLAASGATLPTGRCCRPGRASSPPPLGRVRFSAESCQNALGDFELIEPVAQLCPLGIEPREPLGNPQRPISSNVAICRLPPPPNTAITQLEGILDNDELRLVLRSYPPRVGHVYVYAGGGRSRRSRPRASGVTTAHLVGGTDSSNPVRSSGESNELRDRGLRPLRIRGSGIALWRGAKTGPN